MSGSKHKSQTILVVGGGIAGITSAVELAETGCDVILIEKSPSLGGMVSSFNRYFPKLCHPTCGLEINYQRIKKNPKIKILTMTEAVAVSGIKGNYEVNLKTHPRYVNEKCTACGKCAEIADTTIANASNYGLDKQKAAYLPNEHAYPMRYIISPEIVNTEEANKIKAACEYDAIELEQKEEESTINVGAIIWATGWKPYDASKLETYNYSNSQDIITNVEMERYANHEGPTNGKIVRPSNGEPAKNIALIQCAGSRDINHLSYCSMICCLASLKHATYIREQYEDSKIDIYYIDIRAHDKMESFYQRVKKDPNINFIKSKPASISVNADGKPVLSGEHTIERDLYNNEYDLVVLATGMEPNLSKDMAFSDEIIRDDYGFIAENRSEDGGQFSIGVANSPTDVMNSTQSATAAALKAIQALG